MPAQAGTLFIVPTPIGNLQDITLRACDVLRRVTTIAAEDTRRCRKLLQLLDIEPVRIVPLHEHNEDSQLAAVLQLLGQGEQIALLSDAGTPLISDPGHLLLRALWSEQQRPEGSLHSVRVVPLPGPSALLTALSACPLPLHQFTFAGFLPAKTVGRQARLRELLGLPGAFALFEAPHRLAATLTDIAELAAERRLFVARELTKLHESLLLGTAAELLRQLLAQDALRGEFVVVVEGPAASAAAIPAGELDAEALLFGLAEELKPAQAARVAAKLTGLRRADLYAKLEASKSGR